MSVLEDLPYIADTYKYPDKYVGMHTRYSPLLYRAWKIVQEFRAVLPKDFKFIALNHIIYDSVLVSDTIVNAAAGIIKTKRFFIIELNTAALQADDDTLRLLLGHEIAHLVLGHSLPGSASREQCVRHREFNADVVGELLCRLIGMDITKARDKDWLPKVKEHQALEALDFNYNAESHHPTDPERYMELCTIQRYCYEGE